MSTRHAITRTPSVAVLVVLTLTVWAADGTPAPLAPRTESIGYLGDGTGVYPGSRPPTRFGTHALKTEKYKTVQGPQINHNILWRAPLANWGSSAPVPVQDPSSPDGSAAAGRVFVVSEPGWKSDWPVLQCFSDRDGKLLWERELDHLEALPLSTEERAEVRKTWATYWADQREAYTNGAQVGLTRGEERSALIERFNAEGRLFKYSTAWTAGVVSHNRKNPRLMAMKDAMAKIARSTGLRPETWSLLESGGMATYVIGYAFATPISDGERIYVSTAYNAVFCYDLEGRLQWLRPGSGNPSVGGTGGSGGQHFCATCPSPRLHKDRLIVVANHWVRVLDRQSGAVLWEGNVWGGSRPENVNRTTWGCGLTTPMVMTVGGEEFVVGLFAGNAYRLRDGQPVAIEPPFPGGSMQLVVDPQRPDTLYLLGGGNHSGNDGWRKADVKLPNAYRLTLDGTILRRSLLWQGINGQSHQSYVGLLVHEGRLFVSTKRDGGGLFQGSLDAVTGKVLTGTQHGPSRQHDGTWLLLAGGHLYGLSHRGGANSPEPKPVRGVVEVYTLDGRKVAENWLFTEMPAGEKLQQIQAQEANGNWNWFNQSGMMNVKGDRLYVRSNDHLLCIGDALRGRPGDDPAQVAGIRQAAAPDCTAHLNHASPQYRLEAVQRLRQLAAPLAAPTDESLRRLLAEDPYPEIRAAAVQTLDACDAQGQAGWQHLTGALLGTVRPKGRWLDPWSEVRWRETLETMGKDGLALVQRHWPKLEDLSLRALLLETAGTLGWRLEDPAQTLAAAEGWSKDRAAGKQFSTVLPAYLAGIDAAADPALADTLLQRHPTEWLLFPTFRRHLPAARLSQWLDAIARTMPPAARQTELLDAWRGLGPVAVPVMERCAADLLAGDPTAKDHAAKKGWAEKINDTLAEMKGLKKPKQEKEDRD